MGADVVCGLEHLHGQLNTRDGQTRMVHRGAAWQFAGKCVCLMQPQTHHALLLPTSSSDSKPSNILVWSAGTGKIADPVS